MGTCTDIDGNVYNTVIIGTQEWTVENFRCTKLNDGTEIPDVTGNSEWAALSTPGRCWYNNDYATYWAVYGALYNWHTVNTGKLAIDGWHIPSHQELLDLADFFGGISVGGGPLKETGTTHWLYPNSGATNSSGFTALPGGGRSVAGAFSNITKRCLLWTQTEYDASSSYYHYLRYNGEDVDSDDDPKTCGYSIRLVRDAIPDITGTGIISATIGGTLILNGNLICEGGINLTSKGLIIPVPDELMESYNERTEDEEE